MSNIFLNIVYEDQLSEAVICQLLRFSKRNYIIQKKIPGNGCDYIIKRINSFIKASRHIPFFILLDSDKEDCAKRMVEILIPSKLQHSKFLLRIAVREVESWLLADYKGISTFLGISEKLVDRDPEKLVDAKTHLISLARRSRKREISSGIVPQSGTSAKQGPRYNQVLIPFVQNHWNILAATGRSKSLKRTVKAINNFQS
jgi:hypothetical protein